MALPTTSFLTMPEWIPAFCAMPKPMPTEFCVHYSSRDGIYEFHLQTPTNPNRNPPALSLCLSSIVDFLYSVGLLVFKILPMLFVSLLARFEHTRL